MRLTNAIIGLVLIGAMSTAAPLRAATLYGIDDGTNSLVTIDRTSGAVTVIGPTGVANGNFGDLTYDSNHGVLYWVAGGFGDENLYTISPTTGAATLVGFMGVPDVYALAYDTANDTLYAANADRNFYSINPATAASTLIGNNNLAPGPGGLSYVAATDTLYETTLSAGTLSTINISTSAATQVSAGAGFLSDNGVTWDPLLNVFWADDWSNKIYRYSSDFNSRVLVNTWTSPLDGIAFVDSKPIPEPASLMLMIGALLGFSIIRCRRGGVGQPG